MLTGRRSARSRTCSRTGSRGCRCRAGARRCPCRDCNTEAERRRAFAEAGANAAETSSEVALTAGATEDEEGEVAYQAAIEIELPLWRSRKTAKKERGYGERQAELHAERAERDLQLRADASWSHINLKAHRLGGEF